MRQRWAARSPQIPSVGQPGTQSGCGGQVPGLFPPCPGWGGAQARTRGALDFGAPGLGTGGGAHSTEETFHRLYLSLYKSVGDCKIEKSIDLKKNALLGVGGEALKSN